MTSMVKFGVVHLERTNCLLQFLKEYQILKEYGIFFFLLYLQIKTKTNLKSK